MPTKKTSKKNVSDAILQKNIFDILGIGNISDDQKQSILQKMLQIIYQRVVARIMDVLPEDALRQLKISIDAQDEQTGTAILKKNGMPSFAEMMGEEALFMKYEMEALSQGDAVLAS